MMVVATSLAFAQTPHTDTVKVHTQRAPIKTLAQNLQITQSVIHRLAIDALLRDKLDSIYTLNMNLLGKMWGDTTVIVKPKKK